MYPYRVFISYSRKHDSDKAEAAADQLRRLGAKPRIDKDIHYGAPFTREIKNKIAYSHLFLPILTEQSDSSTWVHQELGYAMGIGVPILPIAWGTKPSGLAAELQAAILTIESPEGKGASLVDTLTEQAMRNAISGGSDASDVVYRCAAWLEKRTELIVDYATSVERTVGFGRVRHIAVFGSFSIPDAPIRDKIWDGRDGSHSRSPSVREQLRDERRILEAHAFAEGCDMILRPNFRIPDSLDGARAARLRILRSFLDQGKGGDLRIVISDDASRTNFISVGDCFFAESVTPRAVDGYVNTLFTSHAPTVLERIEDFDRDFTMLFEEKGMDGPASVQHAIETIDGILKEKGKAD